jgi:hypothetical protein
MASAVEMACPSCDKALKVPPAVFGKRIKCKHCGHAFVARDPDAAPPARPTKPGGKPAAAPAASPPPPPPPKKPFLDDDDEGPSRIEVIKEESDIPRCPHCAKELDPPDAIVCKECGFNNRTRAKANVKKVWAPGPEDWFRHLLPGIVALLIVIGLIVVNVMSIMNMREWLAGSFLEMDEKDAAGRTRFFVAPGAFIAFIAVPSLLVMAAAGKYAFRRLVQEFRPPEQLKL